MYFVLGAKPPVRSLNDLWEGIFPGFPISDTEFDTCILWLVGIGSEREEAGLLLWIIGH